MSTSVISEPQVSISIIGAAPNVSNQPQKVLFINQMTSAGTATSGALVQNIGNDGSESTLFGVSSMLAQAIRQFRKINKIVQVDAIPLVDNAGGTAASGTIAVSGTATATGSINIIIGSINNYTIPVTINSGDTAATVAASINTAINAVTTLPVTSTVATSTVTMSCVHKGTVGNKIAIEITGAVAGVTFTLTGMSGGVTNPTLTTLFDPISDIRYQTIVWPSTFNFATVANFLDGRFNVNNIILDGVAVSSVNDTFSNLATTLNALNSKSLAINCEKIVNNSLYKGSSLLEFDDVIAAQFAAIRSLRLTDGADISRYVISTNGARDSFGGAALASFPYFNTPFFNLPLVAPDLGFTSDSGGEIDQLLTDGGFVIGNNIAGNTVIAGQVVTTYKTDTAGNPDTSFKYLEYVDTISNIREYFFNNLKAKYAQTRLTTGALVNGRSMANGASIEADLDGIYQTLSGEDYVLTQAGDASVKYFKENRTVSTNTSTGTVTVTMKVPIVVQFRKLVASIQLSFNTFSN